MAGQSVNVSSGIGAIGIWVIFFWGDPDIADALIHFLMNFNG